MAAELVSYPAVGTGNGIMKAVSPGRGGEDGSIASPRTKVSFLAPQLCEQVSMTWNCEEVSVLFRENERHSNVVIFELQNV